MRESEEYLDSNVYQTNEGNIIDLTDAEHAINLAYKEGYNQAIEECLTEIEDYGYEDSRITRLLKALKK